MKVKSKVFKMIMIIAIMMFIPNSRNVPSKLKNKVIKNRISNLRSSHCQIN